MQFKTLILLFSAISLFACSSTQKMQKQESPIQVGSMSNFNQKGFSLSIPDQADWKMVKNDAYKVVMTKPGAVNGERYTIQALVVKLPKFNSDKDFVSFITNRMEKSQKKSQVKVIEKNAQLVEGKDTKCVQYNSKEEYSGKSKPVMLEIVNFTCRHTDKENAGVYLAYSKKYSAGNNDKNFAVAAADIFSHMKLAAF